MRGVDLENCKICGSATYSLGRSKVLDKYWADYLRCRNCHFVFTKDVTWLADAYSEAINTADLGLVGRNIRLSYSLTLLIKAFLNRNGKFLDYGGGYGLLVRIMRDYGLNFFRFDEYCQNLFAKGFDAELPPENAKPEFELLVAIEVFEHLLDPVSEVQKMMRFSKNIFFATETLPDDREVRPGEWSYYGMEHGQHIAFFTRRSLEILAEKVGLNYATNGKGLHFFSEKKLSDFSFRFFTTATFGTFGLPFLVKKSLLQEDYKKVTGHDL